MKTKKYNKSEIMKEANYWKRVLGYTMSESLKMAWRNAKKKIAIQEESKKKNEQYEQMYIERAKNTKVCDMSYLANSLINYYNGYGYKGD